MTQTRAQTANVDKADKHAAAPKQEDHEAENQQHDDQNTKTKAEHAQPRKRKDSKIEDPDISPPPRKAARKDSDTTTKTETDSTKADPVTILRFLLSPSSLPLTAPQDSLPPSSPSTSPDRTYATTPLTPFEELLSAVVLSRPISHRLGQRAIRTLLSPPHSLTTPGAVRAAGKDGVWRALEDARTQHKDKTAEQVEGLAEVVCDLWAGDDDEEDGSLKKCRAGAGRDVQREREWLRKEVKGLGATGLDIFCRRVQWRWGEVYPFVDGRTAEALAELGLPGDAGELRGLVEGRWEELGNLGDLGVGGDEDGDGDVDDQRKRRAFVLVLERAVGASLEKNSQRVLQECGK
ncbi:hypothetical protein BJ166DRAFT_516119 [Pestalotiopsis sp. NC0098]|nr:hypothetical protein BJ166DRAFT_516119 [Pestalotiopsis sp. NC0098]